MGLALAAELNGHPSRVIELADILELTADQRGSVKALFDSMKAAIFRRVADQHGCHGEWAEGS
jgi:hypothetical protein